MTRFEKFFIYSLFFYAGAILVFSFVLYRTISSYERLEKVIVEIKQNPPVQRMEIKQVE